MRHKTPASPGILKESSDVFQPRVQKFQPAGSFNLHVEFERVDSAQRNELYLWSGFASHEYSFVGSILK